MPQSLIILPGSPHNGKPKPAPAPEKPGGQTGGAS